METSETKNGKSKTLIAVLCSPADWALLDYVVDQKVRDISRLFLLTPSERYQKNIFYHFNPETTELRRTYLRIIQIFEKIIDKDRFT